MEIFYEEPKRFKEEDYKGGSVTPSALVRAFQGIAAKHEERTENGIEALMKRGLIWVLTGMRYRVEGELRRGHEYTLSTYPRPNGSRLYERDFYIREGKETLVKAASQWCLLNYQTRKIEQVELVYKGEFSTKEAFPEKLHRLRPRGLLGAGSYTVQATDLDGNDHMNNCRYIDIALAALGDPEVKELTVNFAKETRLGDILELGISEDRATAAGTTQEGTLIFALTVR